MQVLMTSTYCGARGNYPVGGIFDLDPDFAEDLIAHGDAEEIGAEDVPIQALKVSKKTAKPKGRTAPVEPPEPEETEGDM